MTQQNDTQQNDSSAERKFSRMTLNRIKDNMRNDMEHFDNVHNDTEKNGRTPCRMCHHCSLLTCCFTDYHSPECAGANRTACSLHQCRKTTATDV
jgi:hypothetical protein